MSLFPLGNVIYRYMKTYSTYTTRAVEQLFLTSDLEAVCKNLFAYLSASDSDGRLRKIHYMDLARNVNDGADSYREPYFLMADVTDFADYTGWVSINHDDPALPAAAGVLKNLDKGMSRATSGGVTGKGQICLHLECDDCGAVYYKLRVDTYPIFLNWAQEIISFVLTGAYR